MTKKAAAARQAMTRMPSGAERRDDTDEALTGPGPFTFQTGEAASRRWREGAPLPPPLPQSLPAARPSASSWWRRLLHALRRLGRPTDMEKPAAVADEASAEFEFKIAERWPSGWFGPPPTIKRRH